MEQLAALYLRIHVVPVPGATTCCRTPSQRSGVAAGDDAFSQFAAKPCDKTDGASQGRLAALPRAGEAERPANRAAPRSGGERAVEGSFDLA